MNSLRGYVLVASPRMVDPQFERSVILVVKHDRQGAVGVVLNRSADDVAQAIWSKITQVLAPMAPVNVRSGGPQDGPILAIGRNPSSGSMRLTTDVSLLHDEPAKTAEVEDLRVYIGCAGWDGGQLESEVEQGDWLIAPARSEHVFGENDELWQTAVHEVGSRVFREIGIADGLSDPLLN